MHQKCPDDMPTIVSLRSVQQEASASIEAAYIGLCRPQANNSEKSFGVKMPGSSSSIHDVHKKYKGRNRRKTKQRVLSLFHSMNSDDSPQNFCDEFDKQLDSHKKHYEQAISTFQPIRKQQARMKQRPKKLYYEMRD